MDRYQFEDAISAYLDNELSLKERKEFESYLSKNPDMNQVVDSIKNTMNLMKNMPTVSTSENFMPNLSRRIDFEKNRPSKKQSGKRTPKILGFTPLYAGLMSVLVVAFVWVGKELLPENSNLPFMDKPAISQSNVQDFAPGNPTIPNSSNEPIFVESEPDSSDSLDMIPEKRYNLENKISLVKDQR